MRMGGKLRHSASVRACVVGYNCYLLLIKPHLTKHFLSPQNGLNVYRGSVSVCDSAQGIYACACMIAVMTVTIRYVYISEKLCGKCVYVFTCCFQFCGWIMCLCIACVCVCVPTCQSNMLFPVWGNFDHMVYNTTHA